MTALDKLTGLLSSYLSPRHVDRVMQAYHFSARAHEGQQRMSGESFINHPLAVASILAEMGMDHQTLMAAMLHDVIEDTPTAKNKIRRKFGKNVAELVDGVSKLTRIRADNIEEAQARNFRKMLMAMSGDIRVILVKLADRLHNMQTLEYLPDEKRLRIARETLDIYVPIAHRLGLNKIRLKLSDLVFSVTHPKEYEELESQVRKARGNRKEITDKIINTLRFRLRQEKISADIYGREKHLYGIYEKMRARNLTFKEINDIYGFRILVNNVDSCYRALGVVHNLYKPVPGKFKDYIAIPKTNGYQSLHTVMFSPYGVNIEVQIRTGEMNDVAETGIAAHWLYKSGEKKGDRSGAHRRAHEWLQHILEVQKNAGDSREFLDNVKIDLLPDDVYLFTPKGKIIELPRGATVVDFAYAIHTDVGNTCTGARVNHKLAPLGTELLNGQMVEIITASDASPNPAWLQSAITAKARSGIRHYLKNLRKDEAAAQGLRLLNRELDLIGYRYDQIRQDKLSQVLESYHIENEQDLLAEVGLGDRPAPLIAKRIADAEHWPDQSIEKSTPSLRKPLVIKGTEGMVVHFPKCCYPIPGDPILGFNSAGHGIVIHRHNCATVKNQNEQADKWLELRWEEDIKREFVIKMYLTTINQRGVLATIAAAISEQGANIMDVEIKHQDDCSTRLDFDIEIRDRKHLARVLRRVKLLENVSAIESRPSR